MAITVMLALQYDAMASLFFVVLCGYLIGSIPIADLVTRRVGAPNLRDVGDRNPGFWNSRSVLNRNQSMVVFVGDLLKGTLSTLLARQWSDDWRVWFFGAAAAMIGHAWPLFAMFSGGRSVLTWVGAAIIISPWVGAFCILMFLLFWAATRSFSYAVRIGVILYPLTQWYADGIWFTAATGLLMTIIGLRFAMANGLESTVRAASPAVLLRRRAADDGDPGE